MHPPIRVLLDVTQFGVVQESQHLSLLRAGIHRVIAQTVRSVSAAPGAAVTLCAREKTRDAVEFLEEHADLRTIPFRPSRVRLGVRLRNQVLAREARTGAHPPSALPLRVVNKAVSVVNQRLDRRARGDAVGRAAYEGADVFHSPVYALPAPGERVRGLRYVLTVYDVIPFLYPELSFEGGEDWLQRILDSLGPEDHVLAISEHTRRDLLDARPDLTPERVHVTPLAADPERFYPCTDAARAAAARARYGVPDAPYVLAVGTLEPRKNIPHLIRAFADLVRAERLDDLHLVLTGAQGWDYDAIRASAGGVRHLRDRIVFTGFVDDADLAPLYTGALVFVYPSLYEGFGLPPLEAMQCGTPVIASNTSSFPEVVGDAGVLVDPRDGAALAQAILGVYQDPARRAELAARALARAREFTWGHFAERTVAGYRAALGPGGGAR